MAIFAFSEAADSLQKGKRIKPEMPVNQPDKTKQNKQAPTKKRGTGLRRGNLAGLLMLFCLMAGHAQQEGNQMTQFMHNTYSYNPGFAGLSNGICTSVLHRQQWIGIGKGLDESVKITAPNSTIIMAHMPIRAIKGGIGVEIASFNASLFRQTYVKAGYAYHLQTSFGVIGMGIRAQLQTLGMDGDFNPRDEGDPIITDIQESETGVYGDVSVGFYLQGNGGYFVGIAANNLISHKSQKIAYQPSRTFVLHGGYTFSFPSLSKIEFTPSTYLETDFATFNWSIAMTGTFNKRFWAGLSYRLQDAVSILGGVNIGKLQLGLAYDITASRFIRASKMGGAFEVSVKYCFGLEGDNTNTEYKNARYL